MGKVIEFIKRNKVSIAIISVLAIGGGIAITSEERKLKRLKSENKKLSDEKVTLEKEKDAEIEQLKDSLSKREDRKWEELQSQRFALILKDENGENGTKKGTKMWYRPGHNYKFPGIPISDKQIGDLDRCISKIIKDSCNIQKDVKIGI